jgi:hypothetical protein
MRKEVSFRKLIESKVGIALITALFSVSGTVFVSSWLDGAQRLKNARFQVFSEFTEKFDQSYSIMSDFQLRRNWLAVNHSTRGDDPLSKTRDDFYREYVELTKAYFTHPSMEGQIARARSVFDSQASKDSLDHLSTLSEEIQKANFGDLGEPGSANYVTAYTTNEFRDAYSKHRIKTRNCLSYLFSAMRSEMGLR